MELYHPKGSGYELCAVGSISLKQFLTRDQPKSITGLLKMVTQNDGETFATVNYDITIKTELAEAFVAQKKRLTAASYLALHESDTELDQSMYNSIVIEVRRCSQLDVLTKGKYAPSTYVLYEFYDFNPLVTTVIHKNADPEFNAVNSWTIPLGDELNDYLRSAEITFNVIEDCNELTGTAQQLAYVNIPLYPLRHNKAILGKFPLMTPKGETTTATIELSIYWKFEYTAPNEQIELKQALPMPIVTTVPLPEPQIQLATPLPSNGIAAASDAKQRSSTSSETSSSSTFDIDVAPAPRITTPKVIDENVSKPRSIRTDDGSEDIPALQSPLSSEISASSEVEITTVGPKEEQMHTRTKNLSEELSTSESSGSSERKPEAEVEQEPKNVANFQPQPVVDLSESEREEERSTPTQSLEEPAKTAPTTVENEVKTLPDRLPSLPVAAARKLPGLHVDEQLSETASKPQPPPRARPRAVEFADPIHQSIPPSEATSYESSMRSSTEENHDLVIEEDIPVISASAHQPTIVHHEPDEPASPNSTVSIHVKRLYVLEHSTLLDQAYDGVNVFIEWKFLDLPPEDCETVESLPLPRDSHTPCIFNFRKVYGLSRRRTRLLKQWVELGNRLDFTLVADGGDDGECDDLGVAQLDLSYVANEHHQTIRFLDVNGEELAELDIEAYYSEKLLRYIESSNDD
ncbi:unnamed protein product [Toxocara canis]|uniref:C2 domain-containing protein n=1 Tax=Toxocara canis TaxID=6265 RepID=A0A3P7FA75_TOXCA|nr:unnamed protein product [Toxocara canis]